MIKVYDVQKLAVGKFMRDHSMQSQKNTYSLSHKPFNYIRIFRLSWSGILQPLQQTIDVCYTYTYD